MPAGTFSRPSYRWAVLALGVAAQGSFAGYSQGLASIGPVFQSRFEISLVQTGLLLTSVSIGVALTLVLWGMAADRVGERTVLGLGLGLAGLALLVAARVPGFQLLAVSLVVAGMAGSCTNAASGRAVMGWFGREERGTALGIRQMATPLGAAVAASVLPLLALRQGLAAALTALGLVSIAAAVACALWIRSPARAAREPGRVEQATVHPLRDRRIWRLSLGGSLLTGGQLSVVSYAALFLTGHRGWSLTAAASVLAVIQFGGAGSRVLTGVWSDRRAERLRLMRMIALGGVVTLALVAASVDAPIAILVPVLVVAGVVSMSSNGLAFTATGEIAGLARSATAMGLQNTALFVTGVFVPILFGAVVSVAGWPTGFAGLALLAFAGWWVLRPLVALEAAGWEVPAAA